MKLVRKDNHNVEITGTLERLYGQAWIAGATRLSNGSLDLDYEGSTDVWWDDQETVEGNSRERIFIDENGEQVHESGVELIDEDDEDEE